MLRSFDDKIAWPWVQAYILLSIGLVVSISRGQVLEYLTMVLELFAVIVIGGYFWAYGMTVLAIWLMNEGIILNAFRRDDINKMFGKKNRPRRGGEF